MPRDWFGGQAYRFFEGKEYRDIGPYRTKADARKDAVAMRKAGYQARVVGTSSKRFPYHVFRRG